MLLSGHLLGNSCPLGWQFVLLVFCLFVIFIYFPLWFWGRDLPFAGLLQFLFIAFLLLLDILLKNDQNNKHDFHFDKTIIKLFLIDLNTILIENACHIWKFPIKCLEIIQFAFMCTICTRVQICITSKVGANLHPGNLHPGANS